MSQNRGRDDLIAFVDYLGQKGLIPRATAAARKTAAVKVLSALSDEEAEDVLNLDVDLVMQRFDNLNPRKYTPDSLQTYRSRLKTAIEDFKAYSDNPVAFKISGQARTRKSNLTPAKTTKSKPADKVLGEGQDVQRSAPAIDLPGVHQLPIPLRQNLTVRVFGLPFDLTRQEAQKIANIVLAHALPD